LEPATAISEFIGKKNHAAGTGLALSLKLVDSQPGKGHQPFGLGQMMDGAAHRRAIAVSGLNDLGRIVEQTGRNLLGGDELLDGLKGKGLGHWFYLANIKIQAETITCSAVPQMRERGLRSVLLHMSKPMTKQMWCC
jgi:hypothetical protein